MAGGAPTWHRLGETALRIEFAAAPELAASRRARALAARITAAELPGVCAALPATASVFVEFAPDAADERGGAGAYAALRRRLEPLLDGLEADTAPAAEPRRIPVCYAAACAPDLAAVAARCGLRADEVVSRHVARTLEVACIGFAPGFPYLLGMDPRLQVPRRATPRRHVPAGSVAIGGAQTGIYPRALPGGWQLIGRTPLRLFDPARAGRPSLLQPGDRVRFEALDPAACPYRGGEGGDA